MQIAQTPKPPYYAVIFTSFRTEIDNGYDNTAQQVLDIASKQPGFLGFESARNKIGISVSYWKDLKSIDAWRLQVDHKMAKSKAPSWYKTYKVRISKVLKDY